MNIYKPHPNVSFRTMVTIDLSASQWCLKTNDWPRTIIEQVASYLNKRLTLSFNIGDSKDIVRQQYNMLTEQFKLYLTNDTDCVFESLVDAMYAPRKFPVD